MIDITITATIRPEILNNTLMSFYDNCFSEFQRKNKLKNLQIIINIDPIGDSKYKQKNVLNICNKYSKKIIHNYALIPHFTKAVKWCWAKTKNKYVFHLEDDWILNEKIDLSELIYYINNNIVSVVRLYKRDYPINKPYEMFDCEYEFDGQSLFIAKNNYDQFGLNPSLIDKKFINEALLLMNDYMNPEKQFRYRNKIMRDFLMKYKYGIYGKPGNKALVTDIGTFWRDKMNFKKPNKNDFVNWI